MADLLRGEIRWANIEPVSNVVGHEQGDKRPALILSLDGFNASSKLVIVALIGSSPINQTRPHSRQIQSVQMPNQPSWVLTDHVRTLSEKRMEDLIGKMSEPELISVIRDIFRLVVGSRT